MRASVIVTISSLAALATVAAAATARQPPRPPADVVYVARLEPVNAKAAGGAAGGEIRFTIHGDSLTIRSRVHGVPPSIEHWQHFHGFADGRQARCSPAAADTSGDGYVDIRETEPSMGTTMVPFNADPVAMEIPTNTYPHASADGSYDYRQTVSLSALDRAFASKFGGGLDLERRVVQVHGVPGATQLPASVASLGTIPARVTLPIACGRIVRLR